MKTPEIDYSLSDLTVGLLNKAVDVTNAAFVPSSTVIRIAAIEESRIKVNDDTVGVFMPIGSIEYYSVKPNTKIVIAGKVNIMDL